MVFLFFVSTIGQRLALPLLLVLLLCASPFLLEIATEEVQYTQMRLEQSGDTADESAHYRIALLLIYGKEITKVGWLGNPQLVGLKYSKTTSIDNAWLYLFIIGGWIGGGIYIAVVVTLLWRGIRRIWGIRGHEASIIACATASMLAMAGSMFNVWFSPEYAPFFWLSGGILLTVLDTDPTLQSRRPLKA